MTKTVARSGPLLRFRFGRGSGGLFAFNSRLPRMSSSYKLKRESERNQTAKVPYARLVEMVPKRGGSETKFERLVVRV